MKPVPFEHKNALLKKEHMEVYILCHKAAIHYQAVVLNNTGIK